MYPRAGLAGGGAKENRAGLAGGGAPNKMVVGAVKCEPVIPFSGTAQVASLV